MKKVQTGLVIEFYSNSCFVNVGDINLKCIAIKGVVVGDMVEIEVIQDSNEIKGKIINLLPRIWFHQNINANEKRIDYGK